MWKLYSILDYEIIWNYGKPYLSETGITMTDEEISKEAALMTRSDLLVGIGICLFYRLLHIPATIIGNTRPIVEIVN